MKWLYRIKNYFSKRWFGLSMEDIALLKSEAISSAAHIAELKDEISFWRTRSKCHQEKIKTLETDMAVLMNKKTPLFSRGTAEQYLIGRSVCLSSETQK